MGSTTPLPIEYRPFGTPRRGSDISKVTDYNYTDQEFDRSTGLYNYNARLYNPEIGMFVTPDSWIPDEYNPQYLNRYAYVRNNPLRYTDPSGHVDVDVDEDEEQEQDEQQPGQHEGLPTEMTQEQAESETQEGVYRVVARVPRGSSGSLRPNVRSGSSPSKVSSLYAGAMTVAVAEPTPFGEMAIVAIAAGITLYAMAKNKTNKTDKHSSEAAREAAKRKWKKWKDKLAEAKRNRSPKDVKDAIKKKIKHWKDKMDWKGDTDWRRGPRGKN